MLKSENSAKNSYKSSPNNSLDWKGVGAKEEEERNERLCKLSYQIRISKHVILNPRFWETYFKKLYLEFLFF